MLGFKEYLISRSQKVGDNYKYVIYENDDSPPRTVVLEGPANDTRDPLKEYRRLKLAVKSINNKLYITGMKNGEDCVLKITHEQT